MDNTKFINSIIQETQQIYDAQETRLAFQHEFEEQNDTLYQQYQQQKQALAQQYQNAMQQYVELEAQAIRKRDAHIILFLLEHAQWYTNMEIVEIVLHAYQEETRFLEYTGNLVDSPLIVFFQELFYLSPLVEQVQPLSINTQSGRMQDDFFPSPWIAIHEGTTQQEIADFCAMFVPYIENIKQYYENKYQENIDIPLHIRIGNNVFNICLMLYQDNRYSVVETDIQGNVVKNSTPGDLKTTLEHAMNGL